MNFIKEYAISIILVILIVIIVLITGIFGLKIIEKDETTNIAVVDNNTYINNSTNQNFSKDNEETSNSKENNNLAQTGNLEETNNLSQVSNLAEINNTETKSNKNNYTRNMNKYHLDENYGKVAEIYNNMLDELINQNYIVSTSNGSDRIKCTIDFNKMCFLAEYNDFYDCWAYTGGLLKKYEYHYSTGEVKKESEFEDWMTESADFANFAIDFSITDEDDTWNYQYNANVSRDGYWCYEIIANWNDDYYNSSGEFTRWDGIKKLYIDMNTYNLIEVENTYYLSDKVGYVTYSDFYEYSDNTLELPEAAQNYFGF